MDLLHHGSGERVVREAVFQLLACFVSARPGSVRPVEGGVVFILSWTKRSTVPDW